MRCGIQREVVADWIRRGTQCLSDLHQGRIVDDDLSPYEQQCVEFTKATAAAETDGKLFLVGMVQKMAQGGQPVETVTEKVDAVTGQVLERTVKKHALLPSLRAMTWLLESKWPAEFRASRLGPGGVVLDGSGELGDEQIGWVQSFIGGVLSSLGLSMDDPLVKEAVAAWLPALDGLPVTPPALPDGDGEVVDVSGAVDSDVGG